MPSFTDFLSREDCPPRLAAAIEAVRLRDACRTFHEAHEFAVGDLVRRKRAIAVVSGEGPPTGICIVMRIFPDAEECLDQSWPERFGIRMDLIVGFYAANEDFMFSATDSRRFEPVPESDLVK